MVRALGLGEAAAALPPGSLAFLDVPADSPHSQAAAYLKSLDVLRGYEEPVGSGRYNLRPAEPLKRMHAAAVLARQLGANAEVARDLAYRLYLICERKKWAGEGQAYNALVVAWPQIRQLAAAETCPLIDRAPLAEWLLHLQLSRTPRDLRAY